MTAREAIPPSPRRWPRRLVRVALVLLALALAASWLLQPVRLGPFLLKRIGASLDLQISARDFDYSLRGTPWLVMHDVSVKRPGHPETLLSATRVRIALPWRSLRARGAELAMDRIELDTPRLNLPAVLRWQAARPPSPPARIPPIQRGVHIANGRIDGEGWQFDGIDIDIASLHPRQPLRAQVHGRYADTGLTMPFRLSARLEAPQALLDYQTSSAAVRGTLTLKGSDWSLPAQVVLSGPLRLADAAIRLIPAKFGFAGAYRSGDTRVPLRFGAYGPLELVGSRLNTEPLTVVLNGAGAVPGVHARGSATLDSTLKLDLGGSLDGWPADWPALPLPLSSSKAPLQFALEYFGAPSFDDEARLRINRDATRFDARFRRPEVLRWLDAGASGSPLPPLTGSLSTPRLQLPGATLEGVQIELDDPASASSSP